MVKGMTITLLLASILISGCDQITFFGNKDKKKLPDPQAPIKIVEKFFKDNAPQATSVEIAVLAPRKQVLTLPIESQLQIVSAMQSDTKPLKSGQDIENIRGTVSQPFATVTLNGPDFAMVIFLDSYGLSMGNQGFHRFINPTLAGHLRHHLTMANVMRGQLGQTLDLALKKAAGQANLYQQLPLPTNVE